MGWNEGIERKGRVAEVIHPGTLLCAGVLAVALAACGSGDVTGSPTGEDAASDTSLPEPDAADAGDDRGDSALPGPGPDAEPEIAPDAATEIPDDAGPPPCEPPLSLTALSDYVLPYHLLVLEPSGGTGAYRFELDEDGSGAIVNALSGAYLAGGEAGTADVVALVDLGCEGRATYEVDVVPDMSVAPARAQVPPELGFAYRVEGGSGRYAFELVESASGATLGPDGAYQAGSVPGHDTVLVTDTGTGQWRSVEVDVAEDAVLTPEPEHVFVAVGSEHLPVIAGGSGQFDLISDAPEVADVGGDGDRIGGLEAGEARFDVVDRFTGQTTSVRVTVVAPREAPGERVGFTSSWSRVLGPGDIDGDGLPDAVLAVYEAGAAAFQGGGVYVYRGVDGGIDPAPARVIGGDVRRGRLGRDVAVADLDGDGWKDLVISADGVGVGMAQNGALHLYRGVEGGFFADTPARTLSGRNAYDQLGFSLTVCDFNGDGRPDLAAGATVGENRDLDDVPTNQGAVYLYLGHEDGFLDEPDQILYPQLPDGLGGFDPGANIRWGSALAAGDFNGDLRCDLAVQAFNYELPGHSDDGIVTVHLGRAPDEELALGGLSPLPVRALAGIDGDDPSARFGRVLAAGDVNGDGYDDWVASQHDHDNGAGQKSVGAARVFLGGPGEDVPAATIEPASVADITVEGDAGYDYRGWWVGVAEVNGEAPADLLLGSITTEGGESVGNAGSIEALAGVMESGPDPTAAPGFIAYGVEGGARFGESFAPLGDADGDGATDYLAYASRSNDLGFNVGRPYFVSGVAGAAPLPLDYPGEAVGGEVGRAMAVTSDLDGDGRPELLVGAPERSHPDLGGSAGLVYLYRGTETGFETAPSATYGFHPGHGWGDRFGAAVAAAGDFDGDGRQDFAVVARLEDRPETFEDPAYAPGASCAAKENDTGAVFVFRGSADGLPDTRPAFVYYGPQKGQWLEALAGGADVNGDGYDDLVVANDLWDGPGSGQNHGGMAVVLGRPARDDAITVICEPALVWLGPSSEDRAGSDVAMLGDLDGDGCAELAVGVYQDDLGFSNQGSVRIIYGWGETCASAEPRTVALTPERTGARFGWAVGGGVSVDGDGLEDLAVGGFNLSIDGTVVGGAWFVPGAYLAGLEPEPLTESAEPSAVYPAVDPGAAGLFVVSGEEVGEQLGRSVALVPALGSGGRGGLVAGSPFGGAAGVALAGSARIWAVGADGALQPRPVAVFGGETWRVEGRLGEWVAGGVGGDGGPVVLVGGYDGNGAGLDQGSAYVLGL